MYNKQQYTQERRSTLFGSSLYADNVHIIMMIMILVLQSVDLQLGGSKYSRSRKQTLIYQQKSSIISFEREPTTKEQVE